MNSVTIRLVSCSKLAPSWLIARAAHVTRRFELVPRCSPLLHDEACDNFRRFFCASGAATRLPIIGRPTRSAAPSSFNGWMPSFKSCASSPMPLSTTATFWWVKAHRKLYFLTVPGQHACTCFFIFQVKLAIHVNSCLFGDFLFNSSKERADNCVRTRTCSVWDYLHPDANWRVLNLLYHEKTAPVVSLW